MAIRWQDSLKDVPWGRALSLAPSIAERGKELWNRVARRRAQPPAGQAAVVAGAEAVSALEVRCHALESRVGRLDEETAASFEVVQALAEQHSQTVHVVDLLLARTRVLLRVCALLGAGLVALLVLVVLR